MNILFFQDTLAVSGGEIWVVDAADKLRQKGHGVTLACPSGSWIERRAKEMGLPHFNYILDDEYEGHLRWLLCETLCEEQIDIIFCGIPGYREEVPVLDAAVREAGRGQIVLRLGVTPGPQSLSSDRVGQGFETVRGVVVVSEDIRKHLYKAFPFMPSDQVHVIYNGVDVDHFDPNRYSNRRNFCQQHDIPEHHLLVGSVGRLDGIKNVPLLIEASKDVLRHFENVTFVIAGDGIEKQSLMHLAREADVMDHFRFTGFVDDVPKLLSGLDILAHTAFSEGVPNSVIEAMAMGKCVVATEVGGVPELIEDGVTGLLVPSNDVEKLVWTLCDVLQNKSKMLALGTAARAYIETALNRKEKLNELEMLLQGFVDHPVDIPKSEEPAMLYDLPDFDVKSPFGRW
jgi:glycosyltransferase involved in cell wall biosynthesis